MNISIDRLVEADYPEVRSIFQQGIETGLATFETQAPEWHDWDQRFWEASRIVARVHDKIVGWGALSSVSKRNVYKGVKEDTVYVSPDLFGKGIGKLLLKELIIQSEKLNIWTLQAVMFPENEASIKLHSSLGFREVGRRVKIGQLNGIWRDTILMERRNNIGL